MNVPSHSAVTAQSDSRKRPARRIGELLLGLTAAVLLFAMMLVTVVDVIGRYLLSRPLPGAFELTELMLAMTVFACVPLVCLREEHISVTVLTDRWSARSREIQAMVAAMLGCLVLGIVAWQLFEHSRRLATYGDVTLFLRIPKGPLGYAMSTCSALAALALMLVACSHYRCVCRLTRVTRGAP